MVHILIFGDSITYGAWDIEGGWVQRLRKLFDHKTISSDFHCILYNLGISGDSSEDLIKRFKVETNSRIDENEEVIIIFAIGTNDSQFLNDKNKQRYTLEQFKNNINKLIKLARNFNSQIIFVGLSPIDESKVDPLPWNPNKSYKQDLINRFDSTIKVICEKENIHFIELYNKLKKIGFNKYLEDGVHPNSKGHEEIYKIIKDFLIINKYL